MRRREIVIGLLLSVAVAVWATSSAVFAKGGPPAGHTNNGKGSAASSQVHGKSVMAHGTTKTSSTTSTTTPGANTSGTGSAPVGNNGTTKIDNYTDTNGNDQAHNNEPHVSCSWGVDGYGYETLAPIGNESFLQHAPTLGGTGLGASSRGPLTAQHKTLSNTNPRGTGATYNGATDNSLRLAGAAHPKQGYHVKMTYTSTDGNSQGSTVKHKVFWVQPCTTTPTPTSVSGVGNALALGLQRAVSGMFFHGHASAARAATSAHHAAAVPGTPAFTG